MEKKLSNLLGLPMLKAANGIFVSYVGGGPSSLPLVATKFNSLPNKAYTYTR